MCVVTARLDGTSKPLRPSQLSMEDYLQLDDWKPTTAKPGKKTVSIHYNKNYTFLHKYKTIVSDFIAMFLLRCGRWTFIHPSHDKKNQFLNFGN